MDEMKILLVSDTHGKHIDLISAYVEEMQADICIHAGDFGFYDSASLKALSQEEIKLLVRHSVLSDEQKAVLEQATPEERKKALEKNQLLGCFPTFLEGEKLFGSPVYATWGNHDDAEIVLRLIRTPIPNLKILHEKTFFDLGDIALLGVGGNCVPHKAFTQNCKKGLPGAQCRPTSVLSQYIRLLETARRIPHGKHVILVTHVSPLVEPFLELLAWRIGAELTISGHMGRPNGETGTTDCKRLPGLRQTYQKLVELYPESKKDLELFYPDQKEHFIRHINLPDAEDGYGTLEYTDDKFNFEIRGVDYRTMRH